MSEHTTPDFVTEVQGDGRVVIAAAYLRAVGFQSGDRVSVRITELSLSEDLRRRGITEDEVDAIGDMQREARENVLTFLTAEGSLSQKPRILARLRRWLRSGS